MFRPSPGYFATALLLVSVAPAAAAVHHSVWREALAKQATAAAALQTEDVTQNLGPFGIAGEKFTVVLRVKRLAGTPRGNAMETVSGLEIHDHAGAVSYKRAFAYEIAGGKFSRTLKVRAKLLPTTNSSGLLITYREDSSEGPGETFWQFFGFKQGKLGLFSGPESPGVPGATGMIAGTAMRGGVVGMPMVQPGDPAEVKVWTGSFYVVVPIFVDWRNARLLPGQRCFESGMGAGLREVGCDLRVEADRKSKSEPGFLRMFREPQEYEGGAKHVVIQPDSQVEYLAARGIVNWAAQGELLRLTIPDLWLKVVVDNDDEKAGWIHTDEEFRATGLAAAGTAP